MGKKNYFFELSMEVEISCSGVSGMGKIAQIAMNGFNTNGEENVTQSVMTMERETSLTSTIRQWSKGAVKQPAQPKNIFHIVWNGASTFEE